jgi:hypothetical protein
MHAGTAVELRLEAAEALVDAAPTGGDEVDEQREVVDPRVPLGEQVALDALEPPDELVREAAELCEVARHRLDLVAEPVLERLLNARRQAGLKLRSSFRKRGKLVARPLERRADGVAVGVTGGRTLDPPLRALDRPDVHGRDVTVAVGWISTSWTTRCRPS